MSENEDEQEMQKSTPDGDWMDVQVDGIIGVKEC
jgi:hypothetical protein